MHVCRYRGNIRTQHIYTWLYAWHVYVCICLVYMHSRPYGRGPQSAWAQSPTPGRCPRDHYRSSQDRPKRRRRFLSFITTQFCTHSALTMHSLCTTKMHMRPIAVNHRKTQEYYKHTVHRPLLSKPTGITFNSLAFVYITNSKN